MDVAAIVARNPEFGRWLGKPGYPLPIMQNLQLGTEGAEGAALLDRCGVRIIGRTEGNSVWIAPGSTPYNFVINFGDQTGNCVVIESSPILNGGVTFHTGNATAVLENCEYGRIGIVIDGDGAGFYSGRWSYFGEIDCWVQGREQALIIGEDCMTGWKVGVRTGDFHGLFDLESREILNYPKNTIIGPHVWLGHDVLVMKGAEIGAGSAVGARSIVSKSLPARSLAVGSPARVIRTGVSWTRPAFPPADVMSDIAARPYMQPE